jgi:muramoyltetrapeptide carboxypeptidase
LIASNPKILCGYSDMTALTCAIHAHTGLVTYSGPHYSTFGMRDHFEQTLNWFTSIMFSDEELDVLPASTWSDDAWHLSQDARTVRQAEGPWILNPGSASGDLIGGNLCTLNLLQGTPHMPELAGNIVFVEDDFLSFPENFDRQLESLLQQPDGGHIAALLIGRFQDRSAMTRDRLKMIIATKATLDNVPVVANLDFGHTDPLLTLPVGGRAAVTATSEAIRLAIR